MSRTGSGWINGDRINGLFHLLINGIFLGVISYNPLILTFDPALPGDIQDVFVFLKPRYCCGPKCAATRPHSSGAKSLAQQPQETQIFSWKMLK